MSQRLAEFIWRWRYLLTGIIVAGALAFAPGANITHIDNDISAWFGKGDQVYRDYERFRDEFGGSRSVIIALKADSADRLFSRPTLEFIRDVSADIERVDTVERVASLSTATTVEALGGDDGGIDVRRLIEAGGTQTPEDVRRRAMKDDLIRGDLVSEDGTVTALVVSFDERRIDQVRGSVIQKIHDLVDQRLPPGVNAYYNGSLEISETYNRITLANQLTFTPPIFLITLIAVYLSFNSWRKMLLTIVAVGISVLWALGLYSLLGYSYNVLTSMLVPLIVVLAIADDVHMMQHWDEERRRKSPEETFKATVAHLVTPLLGASATTALGMLSLATSNVVAVRSFGVGSAVGIMVDFVISLVFVPTMLSLMKPETATPPHEKYLVTPMRRIAAFSTRHSGRVLIGAVVLSLVAFAGVRRLRVDTNHINFFSPQHPLGQSARVIDNELSGIYSFQILLEGAPESLSTPANLQRMSRMEEELRKFPDVKKVRSVADYVRRVNKELHDGDPAADVVPSDPGMVAQELFVFTLGGEGRRELERVVASDYSRAQIDVKLRAMSSDVVLQLIERTEKLAAETFNGTGITATTTGSGRLFSTLDHYLVQSQISSFGTAFFTVFGVIFIVFRSARFGFLTIAPNVLPVLAVLGVMGFLDISMNIATVMVASVALGVVDDDTIHFINRYRREVAAGATTDAAIEAATVHEGRASLTTAVINSLGFSVLLLSEYKPTAWFGGLLGLTMAVAFLAEVFILPATIKLMPRMFGADALRRNKAKLTAAVVLIGVTAAPASAQMPTGNVSVLVDHLPNRDTTEMRARLFVEEKTTAGSKIRITAAGLVEGLLGDRAGRVTDAIFEPRDLLLEFRAQRFGLTAGMGRVVWGRLDELQPTDVVNPLDVSRFFFEGRSEARLAVPFVRGTAYAGESVSIDAIYVPWFRRGVFDRLDEGTSPFNLAPKIPFVDERPERIASNAQGGVRANLTSGRVDWSVSAYRGFRPFGLYSAAGPIELARVYPRFTMIGGDFETVSGAWAIRGEAAAFVRDAFQTPGSPLVRTGQSFDAGGGVDRKAGDYRISGQLLLHRETYDAAATASPLPGAPPLATSRTDLSLIASADRSFARQKYQGRLFGVYNPKSGSGFARGIMSASLRDNVAVEGSVGWFGGSGEDTIGRFSDSDFLYLRLKYFF